MKMISLSSLSAVFPRIYSTTIRSLVTTCNEKSLLNANINEQSSLTSSTKPNNVWSLDIIRTNVRNHFPYPRETKRVKTFGYKKRMSTPGGRAVLMRRILKGRHVLSH